MITTIISCETREEARNLTIPQLEAAGLQPRVFLSPCNPAGGRENARVASLALTTALETGESILFCEDDIDLSSAFPSFLRAAQRQADSVVYFYTHEGRADRMYHLYGIEVFNAFTRANYLPAGLYPVIERKYLFNAQCLFIPHAVLQQFDIQGLVTRERPPFQAAFDTVFKNWLTDEAPDVPVLVALPNPVQHRGDRTNRKPDEVPKLKRSRTFTMWEGR